MDVTINGMVLSQNVSKDKQASYLTILDRDTNQQFQAKSLVIVAEKDICVPIRIEAQVKAATYRGFDKEANRPTSNTALTIMSLSNGKKVGS